MLDFVGVYVPKNVFTHGQLYVASTGCITLCQLLYMLGILVVTKKILCAKRYYDGTPWLEMINV